MCAGETLLVSHVSLPFSAAVEVRGRSAKIQLRRVVSGHFRPSQSWKDEKSHKVVPIKPKAVSWADSRFLGKWPSFGASSATGESCRVTPSLGRVTSSTARAKPC